MKISINSLQPSGDFYVPGFRYTVSGGTVHQALGQLATRERTEIEAYIAGGPLPTQTALSSLKSAVVRIVHTKRERTLPH
jgi:hypothetical protein